VGRAMQVLVRFPAPAELYNDNACYDRHQHQDTLGNQYRGLNLFIIVDVGGPAQHGDGGIAHEAKQRDRSAQAWMIGEKTTNFAGRPEKHGTCPEAKNTKNTSQNKQSVFAAGLEALLYMSIGMFFHNYLFFFLLLA